MRVDQHNAPIGRHFRNISRGEVDHDDIPVPLNQRRGSSRVAPQANNIQEEPTAQAAPSASRLFGFIPSWDFKLLRAKHRVLIVEDSVPIQKVMKRWFEVHGHEVTVADNGFEGLALLKQWKYDLVFTDFVMVSPYIPIHHRLL